MQKSSDSYYSSYFVKERRLKPGFLSLLIVTVPPFGATFNYEHQPLRGRVLNYGEVGPTCNRLTGNKKEKFRILRECLDGTLYVIKSIVVDGILSYPPSQYSLTPPLHSSPTIR